MKIAMLVPKFPIISETFILNQITGLIDKGHNIDILTFNKGDTEVIHKTIEEYNLMDRVYYLGGDIPNNKLKRVLKIIPALLKKTPNLNSVIQTVNFLKYGRGILSLRCLYTLINFTERKEYDIIHCQYGPQGVEALVLKNLGIINGKIITSIRGFDITRALAEYYPGYKQLFANEELFLPVCRHFKNILIKNGCPENKIKVLYSGIDINKFKPVSHSKENKDYFHIISTARLEEKKGLKYAIEAVATLLETRNNIKYTIIGDGSLKEELSLLIKQSNAQSNIKLVGRKNQTEVMEYLRSADLFLAPSITSKDGNQEGIPNALKEAMLMLIPVISTFHSGIPELIDDNVTGYLVPEKDSNALYEKIKYVMDNSEKQNEITEQAMKKVKREFPIDVLNGELEKIYKKSMGY
ncbi:glycosyltransferase [Gracilibacillus sp. HCP3S3_G5_1]|uniref:glycosyltransferase n=1 Tax=unclassified Gracilibacillus TaxID=2625209 RepID=UPI003F8ADD72